MTGTQPTDPALTPLEALQTTLAAEHAALYLYGVVGGRVSAAEEPALAARVAAGYAVHRGRRDQLTAMVRAADAEPVAAEVSYVLPNSARNLRQLTATARLVEERSAAVYAAMVGSTARAHRQWALDALHDAAVRVLGFGGTAEPFPGLPEL